MTTTPLPATVAPARHPDDDERIRALFSEYAASLGFSLDYQGFDAELASLPGRYGPPAGALLLAWVGGVAVGVVALRALPDGACEMKRLYLRPAFRGRRTAEGVTLGRALVRAVIEAARARGHRRMKLDTISGQMDAAMRLYRSFGFVETAPYYPSPIPGTVYLALEI